MSRRLNDFVKLHRERRKMSHAALSAKLGWKAPRIYDIERGAHALTGTTIAKLAAAMGLSENDFYEQGARLWRETYGEPIVRTQCFRLQSGSRAATCDISSLSDDTLYGKGVIAGQVRILFDGQTVDGDGTIVTANFFDDDFQQSLVDFEGESEEHCEYAELHAAEYCIEISRHLVRRESAPHIIATQNDVEQAADTCWAV